MAEHLTALATSVSRLGHLVEDLGPDGLARPAYPSEWTIAQVLSHLGSGAVITGLRLDAAIAGRDLDMGVVQSVWDGWNSKSPTAQRSTRSRPTGPCCRGC